MRAIADMILRLTARGNAQPQENHDAEVASVGAVFLAISSLGIAARLVSHRIKRRRIQIDDALLLWAHVRFYIPISDTTLTSHRPSISRKQSL